LLLRRESCSVIDLIDLVCGIPAPALITIACGHRFAEIRLTLARARQPHERSTLRAAR
jgi:hypothetical protein